MVKDIFCKILDNLMHPSSHIQTPQDIFSLLEGLYSSFLMLNFGNVLPITNYGPKCDFAKVMTFKRLRL